MQQTAKNADGKPLPQADPAGTASSHSQSLTAGDDAESGPVGMSTKTEQGLGSFSRRGPASPIFSCIASLIFTAGHALHTTDMSMVLLESRASKTPSSDSATPVLPSLDPSTRAAIAAQRRQPLPPVGGSRADRQGIPTSSTQHISVAALLQTLDQSSSLASPHAAVSREADSPTASTSASREPRSLRSADSQTQRLFSLLSKQISASAAQKAKQAAALTASGKASSSTKDHGQAAAGHSSSHDAFSSTRHRPRPVANNVANPGARVTTNRPQEQPAAELRALASKISLEQGSGSGRLQGGGGGGGLIHGFPRQDGPLGGFDVVPLHKAMLQQRSTQQTSTAASVEMAKRLGLPPQAVHVDEHGEMTLVSSANGKIQLPLPLPASAAVAATAAPTAASPATRRPTEVAGVAAPALPTAETVDDSEVRHKVHMLPSENFFDMNPFCGTLFCCFSSQTMQEAATEAENQALAT